MASAPFSNAPGASLPPGQGAPLDGTTDPMNMSRPLYGCRFVTALKRLFRGYTKFTGRASRSEYWWAQLWSAILTAIPVVILYAGLIPAIIWQQNHATEYSDIRDEAGNPAVAYPGVVEAPTFFLFIIGLVLVVLVTLALILPMLAVQARRLHDAGFSALFILLSFVPLGGIAVLVMTLLPSKPEGRRFDKPALEAAGAAR